MTSYSWTNTSGGSWAAASNWSPTSGFPGSAAAATDVARIAGGAISYTVTIPTGIFDIARLNIAGQNNGVHKITLTVDGSLLVNTLDYTTNGVGNDASISVDSAGTLEIRRTLIASRPETITVSGTGGRLEFGSVTNYGTGISNANVTVSFSSVSGLSSGVIEFAGPSFIAGTTTSQRITGASFGDSFVFDGADFSGDTFNYSNNTLTISSASGTVLQMNNLQLAAGSSGFSLIGNTIEVLCFVSGTHIRTPDGDRPVETLQPGDTVVVLAGGTEHARPVTWMGRRRINLRTHKRPEMVAPIRFLRGAFAENVPERDLLVSPDHGMLIDGQLICARQLVNGTTVLQESGWTAVEYFHVELGAHAILLAEGLPSESYLDTGNRGFFMNSGGALMLHPDLTSQADHPAREIASCVPFVWREDDVRPAWQKLAARARDMGAPVTAPETTTDPDLSVIANGRRLRPLRAAGATYQFLLPADAAEIRIVSRSATPKVAKPWMEDRRSLGVYVERLLLRDLNGVQEIPLDHPGLSRNWWAVEHAGQELRRWTDGSAVLPLPERDGPAVLEVTATNSGLAYLTDIEQQRPAA